MNITEPKSLDELFALQSDLIGSKAQVLETFTGMLTHVRKCAVGSRMPQHAIVWARDAEGGGADRPLVVPILLNLGTDAIDGIARSLALESKASTPGMRQSAAVMASTLGVSVDEAMPLLRYEAALAMLTHRSIAHAAESARAVGVTLFGHRSVVKLGAQNAPEETSGILVNHEHVATGSVCMWLPADSDTDGRFTTVGEWEVMHDNRNQIMRVFDNLLPVSCYGKTARGVS